MADGTIPPFDPGVAGATNLVASAAPQADLDPPIFVKWDRTTSSGGSVRSGPGGTTGEFQPPTKGREPVFFTANQLISAFDNFDREDFLRMRNLFVAAGLLPDTADPQSVRDKYVSIIDLVGEMNERGQMISPMGYVKNLIRMNGLDPSKITADDPAGTEDGDGAQRTVQVNRTVADITEGEAWMALQGQVSQLLGRDPSDQEVRDFTYRMNQMAAENPSISKTITRYRQVGEDDNMKTKTRTVQEKGFTAADMAQEAYDQTQRDPDYAETQAATTYFNAVMGALGPIGG